MIRSRGIAFGALDEDGRFDSPLGESTGAAQIFGASGGVMEAMLRTAAHLKGVADQIPLEWQQLRGVRDAVKTAAIPGVGTVAVCNGIAAAQRMLETDDWRTEFVAIEVMACSGGCLGGGGEPKSMDPDVLKKRSKAISLTWMPMRRAAALMRTRMSGNSTKWSLENRIQRPHTPCCIRPTLHGTPNGRCSHGSSIAWTGATARQPQACSIRMASGPPRLHLET